MEAPGVERGSGHYRGACGNDPERRFWEDSGGCGNGGGVAISLDDAATSRACSNVASRRDEAPGALAIVEEALAEIDAGRIDAARRT